MTWNTATATNYRDMLDQLIELATSRHMATISLGAAGTGYAVGDLLDIDNSGSTRTHDATIEVLSLSGSAIATARIATGGAYTVDPTSISPSTTTAITGGGSGATFTLTFDDTDWTLNRRTQEAVAAAPTIATAGTGYAVNDTLTLVGGVIGDGGSAATYNVDSIGGGGSVATISLVSEGNYEEVPANDAATTVAPAGGSGCELTVTYQNAVTQDDQIAILTGTVAGAANPTIGIKLWQGTNAGATDTTYNWSLFAMTSFSSSLAFHQQLNLSPGLQVSGAVSTTNTMAIVPLKDTESGFPITFSISISPRRIMGAFKVGNTGFNHYVHMHAGFLSPFGTTSEFQYPMYVSGSTNRVNAWYGDTGGNLSGLTELTTRSTGTGPGYAWYPEASTWLSVANSVVSSDTINNPAPSGFTDSVGVFPLFFGLTAPNPDIIVSTTDGWDFRDTMWTDTGQTLIYPSPGGEDLLIPCSVLRTDNPIFVRLGEVEGLFWTSAADGQTSEDIILDSDDIGYRIFQNGNRIQHYSYCAMRED